MVQEFCFCCLICPLCSATMVRDDARLARLMVFNNLQLPSTVGYVDNTDANRIHWDIAYFYDIIRERGHENRGSYKFYRDLLGTVTNKAFASNDVSLRTAVARQGFLKC